MAKLTERILTNWKAQYAFRQGVTPDEWQQLCDLALRSIAPSAIQPSIPPYDSVREALSALENGLENCIGNAEERRDDYDIGYMKAMLDTLKDVQSKLAAAPVAQEPVASRYELRDVAGYVEGWAYSDDPTRGEPLYASPQAAVPEELASKPERLWLIERTYAKGYPEQHQFWLGISTGNSRDDSFGSANSLWTTNALEAARFSTEKIAMELRYRHFHPEAPVIVCEHIFGCGTVPE